MSQGEQKDQKDRTCDINISFQGKMQSENLLRTECGGGYDSDDGTGGGLRGSGGHQYSAYHHQYNVQC